jgi:hypothetical protein
VDEDVDLAEVLLDLLGHLREGGREEWEGGVSGGGWVGVGSREICVSG